MAAYLGEGIPKLGFGLMRLPQKDEHPDIEQIKEMVDLFLAAGFTYFDTARGYGESEAAIREALVERYPRESFQLATKLAAWLGTKNAEDARAMFTTSLEQTGAGYFDYYLLHNFGGPRTQVFEEYGMWDFVRPLKEEGRIRHLGISFHDTAEALAPILDAHRDQIEFVQLQINWADWEDSFVQSRKCYELVRSFDLPVIVMEPVKGGLLAEPPASVKALFSKVDPEASCASWALRFAADLEGLITVLSGMSTVEQMKENIALFADIEPLDEQERAAIGVAREELAKIDLVPCTSCGYCKKACPQDISIPGILSVTNRYRTYGNLQDATGQYAWESGQGAKASECLACGICEDACPQALPIIDLLRDAVGLFERA